MQKGQIIIHTDGGSRGNPGPAACAFIVEIDGKEIFKSSRFLGKKTNNYAEYSGVTLALQWIAKEFPSTKTPKLSNFHSKAGYLFPINFYLDSELVVRQLNSLYKIKNDTLKSLNNEIKELIRENDLEVVFKNIPREKNKVADFLVNEELDKN